MSDNLIDKILTPMELANKLEFHLTQTQADDIAEHVYQPLLNIIKELDGKIKRLQDENN